MEFQIAVVKQWLVLHKHSIECRLSRRIQQPKLQLEYPTAERSETQFISVFGVVEGQLANAMSLETGLY